MTARLLVEAGARLVLNDLDEAGAAVAGGLGPQAVFVAHDVSSAEDWARVVATCRERFGKLDGLVNNAGIAGRDSIATLTSERLRRYLDFNLIGALLGIQAALPAMRAGGGGAIVNIASIAARRRGWWAMAPANGPCAA